jgi:hemin uptake protein HemP
MAMTMQITVDCVSSEELFGRHDRLLIEHGGGRYQLQMLSNGKLLLTRYQGAVCDRISVQGARANRRCAGLYGRIWLGE